MAVTLTYDPNLSRVRVGADGLGAVDTAMVERSTNGGITWTTVRGGSSATVAGGELVPPVDDYEWTDGVEHIYRVSVFDPQFVAAGTASHNTNGGSVTPGLPAGATTGDLLLVWVAIRNSGTGFPNTPAGYTLLVNAANSRLFGKIHTGSEAAPSITFTGGATDASTSAQMCAFSNVSMSVADSASQLNPLIFEVPYPALALASPATVLYLAWKQYTWTSADSVPDATLIGSPSAGIGALSGNAIAWAYELRREQDVPAGEFTVAGGSSAISRGGVAALTDTPTSQTATITPSLGGVVWLKVIGRPFLNRPLPICDLDSSTVRPSRGGVFDVVGRSYPVATTDLRGSRQWSLQVSTLTTQEGRDLDLTLASGQVIFLHTPAGFPERSMYAVVGDAAKARIARGLPWRRYSLPLTEVAAPGPDVVGSTGTWATVLATYATWADVLAAQPSWADLLELIGDPSEVEVP